MNILMMTNTYLPHVGGVARSVDAFVSEYRKRGHRVLVVAPVFDNMAEHEDDVVRMPAIQRFNGSDFSVVLPVSVMLRSTLQRFKPDIVHSHHPFLIGSTALRIARMYELPLVFTNHTMYERYTHYVPGDSKTLRHFVVQLATHYANLCDQVFAPSESIAELLRQRKVMSPIAVVPTGVDIKRFNEGSGDGFRKIMGIPNDAFVIGHLGRLALEKNLDFLTQAVIRVLKRYPQACFLLVGKGDAKQHLLATFEHEGLSERVFTAGTLEFPMLESAYHAMDVFAFSSLSETQGMVLAEAMAAGTPVVALDAPGVREIVRDEYNGRLLYEADVETFAVTLLNFSELDHSHRQAYEQAALSSAEIFSTKHSADKALASYEKLIGQQFVQRHEDYSAWKQALGLIEGEWELLKSYAESAAGAFNDTTAETSGK
ncbi:MAG: glycosyl transferase family 1 [Gammaproteobacteria bacterium]|nr:glycosyltransferase [Gammaproteobacteria bacterium]PCH63608.1 MAG: glycosyl transferase family 1 [Gammaproteobacteria bacterium]